MADDDVQVKLSADITNFSSAMTEASAVAQTSLADVVKAIEALGDALDHRLSESVDTAKSKLGELSSAGENATQMVEGLSSQLHNIMDVAGITLAYEGFMKLGEAIEKATGRAVQFRNMAEIMALTTDQTQVLSSAAEDAGVSFSMLERAGVRIDQMLRQSQEGASGATEKLLALGVSLKALQDPSTTVNDVLMAIHDRLNNAGTASDEMGQLVAILGARAANAAEALKTYDGSAAGAAEKLERLNGLSADQIVKLVELHGMWSEQTTVIANFFSKFMIGAVDVSRGIQDWVDRLAQARTNFLAAATAGEAVLSGVEPGTAGAKPAPEAAGSGVDVVQKGIEMQAQLAREAADQQDALTKKNEKIAADAIERTLTTFKEGTAARLAVEEQYYAAVVALEGADTDRAKKAAESILNTRKDIAQKSAEEIQKWANMEFEGAAKIIEMRTRVLEKQITETMAANKKILDDDAKVREAEIKGAEEVGAARINAAIKAIEAQEKIGALSPTQAAAQEIDLIRLRDSLEDASFRAIAKLRDDDVTANATAQKSIVKADADADAQIQAAHLRAAREVEQQWLAITRPIESAFDSAFRSMLSGTTSFTQAVRHLFFTLGEDLIVGVFNKMVTTWVAGEASKLAATATAQSIIKALHLTTLVTADTTSAKQSSTEIVNAAAVAGANAFASTAAIPYVGPFLAPGAAASAEASVLSFLAQVAVSSAAGGWEVPSDQLAMVHKDEKVLPAHISKAIDERLLGKEAYNAASQGGSGGNVFHINANDAKSFERYLSDHRNRNAIVKAAQKAFNSGNRAFR